MIRPKRFLSLLLAVVMTLTMLPPNALAEEGWFGDDIISVFSENEPEKVPEDGEQILGDDGAEFGTMMYASSEVASGAALDIMPAAALSVAYVRSSTDESAVSHGSAKGDDISGNGSFATPYATLATAYTNVTDSGKIYVLSDLTVTAQTNFDAARTVTIQSYSDETTPKTDSFWTVTANTGEYADGMLFITAGTVTLTNITLNAGGSTRVVRTGSNAEFILESGAILKGGDSTGGGGVYVGGSSTFTMNGGTITSNTAYNGAGVYIDSTFNMNGGEVVTTLPQISVEVCM